MKTKPDDLAFPSTDNLHLHYGLSKREYFAAMAMQNMAYVQLEDDKEDFIAREAVKLADALIKALNEEGNNEKQN